MISKQELLDVLAPRCGYCGHFIANHHGAKGCTSFKAHTDDSDPQPCECGAIRPLKGICSRCGDILHDGDATICELCRGHRGNPWPEREEA